MDTGVFISKTTDTKQKKALLNGVLQIWGLCIELVKAPPTKSDVIKVTEKLRINAQSSDLNYNLTFVVREADTVLISPMNYNMAVNHCLPAVFI